MFRTYQAVLQPTAGQAVRLERLLAAQRELYNAALEERIGVWRWHRRSVTRFDQFRHLTGWEHPALEFGVCPARGTLTRLDRAFAGFYRRCRAGLTPGFPRFRSAARWDSVEYPDTYGWKVEREQRGTGRIHLKGVGSVRFRGAKRGIRGTPKTLTVRRGGNRFRITIFCADVPPQILEPSAGVVGIDVGVTVLVATSHGELVPNPRHLRRALERLAAAQQRVAGRRRGSGRRRQAAEGIGRLHRKIAHQRRDLAHQVSRRLVNGYGMIVYEDLQITNLVRRPAPRPNQHGGHDPNRAAAKAALNREILAAGWGQLLRFVAYKAAEAGRETIAVNPRHTARRVHRHALVHAGVLQHHGPVPPAMRVGHHPP